ncbi:hypothetical protein C9890_0598 [Perkinsus sp. BL_2016]|nr:hypothetical protein C9890_0598 [Perkinsus sp. BL_2016]
MSTKSLAVIGSGPSAMYTVKYVLKQIPSLKIDIFEKLSEPFGLVRFGVAPDHPEVKNVAHEFRDMLETNSNIRMHLNHHITDLRDIRASHSAVLVGIGAQGSKTIPSDFHPHQSARDFVLWYNGHPEGHRPEISAEKCGIVSIVGMGNVALDVARLLSKKSDALSLLKKNGLTMEAIEWMTERQKAPHQKKVQIFARRGYPEAVFTNKEFRELLNVDGAVAVVNPSDLGESFEEIARKVEKDRGKKRGLEILERPVDIIRGISSAVFCRTTHGVGYFSSKR